MKRSLSLLVALGVSTASCKHEQPKPVAKAPPPPNVTTLLVPPSADKPTVAFRLAFKTGSIDDPSGKEGLTALAARLMAEGGTKSLSAAQLQEALFPLAADVGVQVDKEETVFYGRVHKDFQDRLAPLLAEIVAAPRLDEKEFARLQTDAVNRIAQGLRSGDDEQLSRQALLNFMFAGHPYASYVGGSVQSLKAITLADVKAHLARVFTLDRLTVGAAGSYDAAAVDKLKKGLYALPPKGAPVPALPKAPTQIRVRLVEKDTDTTAIFGGYSWDVKRTDPDYVPLAVGISVLGEHRQGGRLFEELRGKRGLNYGDYDYVEHFIQEGYGSYPLPNVGLRQQYYGLWVRSVENANRVFALRAANFVLKKAADEGITQDELDRAKGFLDSYTRLWAVTADRQLAYALDDAFYGTKDFLGGYRAQLGKLTVADVNAALKKHIDITQLHYAVVTRGTKELAADLASGKPSPMKATSAAKDKAVVADDKLIEKFDLGIKDSDIQTLNADELFEK